MSERTQRDKCLMRARNEARTRMSARGLGGPSSTSLTVALLCHQHTKNVLEFIR